MVMAFAVSLIFGLVNEYSLPVAMVGAIGGATGVAAVTAARTAHQVARAGLVVGVVQMFMVLFLGNFRAVFWVACVPALLAVAVLAIGVKEPRVERPAKRPPFPLRRAELARLGPRFWLFLGVLLLLLLPRFSEAFVLLRAGNVGLAAEWVPLILAAMNLVAAAASFPAGSRSDRTGRRGLVAGGFAVLALSQLALLLAEEPALVFLGAGLWGLHLGITQAVLSALVADLAPVELRGTAFGMFHLVSGLAILVGSIAAG